MFTPDLHGSSPALSHPEVDPRSWCITLDVDWAPDFVIDHVASLLLEARVRATWFVTHASPAIQRLREHPDLFEIGIHPNFMPGSTHGRTPEEVFDHCLTLVPDARTMRTHCLHQSTNVFVLALERSTIRIDASLHTPGMAVDAPIDFWWQQRRMVRIPFIWEDDLEMQRPRPHWSPADVVPHPGRILMLNFHPIHVYLNSGSLDPYECLKLRAPHLTAAKPRQLDDLISEGDGTGLMFLRTLERMARGKRGTFLAELAARTASARPAAEPARALSRAA